MLVYEWVFSLTPIPLSLSLPNLRNVLICSPTFCGESYYLGLHTISGIRVLCIAWPFWKMILPSDSDASHSATCLSLSRWAEGLCIVLEAHHGGSLQVADHGSCDLPAVQECIVWPQQCGSDRILGLQSEMGQKISWCILPHKVHLTAALFHVTVLIKNSPNIVWVSKNSFYCYSIEKRKKKKSKHCQNICLILQIWEVV